MKTNELSPLELLQAELDRQNEAFDAHFAALREADPDTRIAVSDEWLLGVQEATRVYVHVASPLFGVRA